MQSIVRSIPLPRTSITRIVKYIEHLCKQGEAKCSEIKSLSLDFGRGIGDITRFLRNLNIIRVEGDTVKLEDRDLCKAISSPIFAKIILHRLFYERLVQYRLIFDLVQQHKSIKLDELQLRLNEELSRLCPNAWVNSVAFKTLIGFLEDLELVSKRGALVVYTGKLLDKIRLCIEKSHRKIGATELIDLNELASCLEMDRDLLEELLGKVLVNYKAPGGKYKRAVIDINSAVNILALSWVTRTSSTEV